MYLIFNNYSDAENSNNKISQNMGLTGSVTTTWSDIIETTDEKFIISKPEERFMTEVINFTEVETYQRKELITDLY